MKKMNFMSGETHIKLAIKTGSIQCNWFNDSDTMSILLASETMKRNNIEPERLIIPYMPYVRQDRVINHDEPFSLKVFGELINSCSFKEVVTNDLHSLKAFNYINNLRNIKSNLAVNAVCRKEEIDVLICPDEGAKSRDVNDLELPVIFASKKRNSSGQIIKTECELEGIEGKNLLIPDDCIAGGRTFIELAKVLKKGNPNKIILFVTHIDDPLKINPEINLYIDEIYHNDYRRQQLKNFIGA